MLHGCVAYGIHLFSPGIWRIDALLTLLQGGCVLCFLAPEWPSVHTWKMEVSVCTHSHRLEMDRMLLLGFLLGAWGAAFPLGCPYAKVQRSIATWAA